MLSWCWEPAGWDRIERMLTNGGKEKAGSAKDGQGEKDCREAEGSSERSHSPALQEVLLGLQNFWIHSSHVLWKRKTLSAISVGQTWTMISLIDPIFSEKYGTTFQITNKEEENFQAYVGYTEALQTGPGG